jgi:uncharacterized protein YraI
MKKLLCTLVLIGLLATGVQAQNSGVYVTTQDFSSLRVGPGIAFQRLTVVPPATTLPAVGRAPDTSWVQVDYNGQKGWIVARLLVWSGDLVSLPVKAVNDVPVVRIGTTGTIYADTQLFDRNFQPMRGIPVVPGPVEITGRLGSGSYIWLQVDYQGQLYWVRSWEIDYGNNYRRVLDIAYLFAYTRLTRGIDADISSANTALSQIENIWTQLGQGGSVSCGYIPAFARRKTADSDVRNQTTFAPLMVALDTAITDINAAISAFADACGRPSDQFFLTQQEVRDALNHVESARRNLILTNSLVESLAVRDPLLGSQSQ